jgi:hypothetical protein
VTTRAQKMPIDTEMIAPRGMPGVKYTGRPVSETTWEVSRHWKGSAPNAEPSRRSIIAS